MKFVASRSQDDDRNHNSELRTELSGTGVLPHGVLLPRQQLPLLLHLKPLLLQLLQPAAGHLRHEKTFAECQLRPHRYHAPIFISPWRNLQK